MGRRLSGGRRIGRVPHHFDIDGKRTRSAAA
jgi:hypothetical protein